VWRAICFSPRAKRVGKAQILSMGGRRKGRTMAGASAFLAQPKMTIERLPPIPLAPLSRETPAPQEWGPIDASRVLALRGGAAARIRAGLVRAAGPFGLKAWMGVLKAAHEDEAAAQGLVRLLAHVVESGALDAMPEADRTSARRFEAIIGGVIALGLRVREWVREPEAWRADPEAQPREMLFQLARHLLVKWDMPACMDGVWLVDRKVWAEYQDWYVRVGAGEAVHRGSPLQLGKPQARFFAEIPRHYRLPVHGFRVRAFLEARVLGASPEFAAVLAESRLGDSRLVSEQEERRVFWTSVARYFIRRPEFPVRQLDPVMDYLSDMKFGWSAGVPPLQPGLVMKGRTPETLLRGMLLWRQDRRRGELGRIAFKPSGRKGLLLKDESGKPVWSITELLSTAELGKESASMHHCVRTYGMACLAGRCSVWSMARITSDGRAGRRLTVEVAPDGRIVQARGRYNRWPLPEERKVLALWAEAEGLSLSNPAMGLLPESLQAMARVRG
jgi:PcfJ-like protein